MKALMIAMMSPSGSGRTAVSRSWGTPGPVGSAALPKTTSSRMPLRRQNSSSAPVRASSRSFSSAPRGVVADMGAG